MGLRLWGASRAADMLTLQLGEPRADLSPVGRFREVGEYALHVQCPWRLTQDDRLLVGSGDLWTPADPDADPQKYGPDVVGSSWLDYQLRKCLNAREAVHVVIISADSFGGFHLSCSDGIEFEVFPNASGTSSDVSEYWRLLQPSTSARHFVVHTGGPEA